MSSMQTFRSAIKSDKSHKNFTKSFCFLCPVLVFWVTTFKTVLFILFQDKILHQRDTIHTVLFYSFLLFIELLSIIFPVYRSLQNQNTSTLLLANFSEHQKSSGEKNPSKYTIFILMLGDIKDVFSGYYYIFISFFIMSYIVLWQSK